MICLGSKSYKQINISQIIDTFEPIRHNFQLPNNNNGTKHGQYIFCNHVWVFKDKTIQEIIEKYGEKSFSNIDNNHLIKWKKAIINNEIQKYYKQFPSNNWKIFNQYLKTINSPHLFNSLPRIGHMSFMQLLMNNKKPIIFGYSLENINDTHQYTNIVFNKKDIENIVNITCHDYKQEMKILIWLHQNNYIDATLCSLVDVPNLTFDCNIIQPTQYILELSLKYFDSIHLLNLDDKYIKNYENIFKVEKNKDVIVLHI